MTTTPRLGAPELAAAQAVPETTVNEAHRYLEQGACHFIFKDRDLTAPPGSPADADCYLVAGSPTGAWAGHAGDIAFRLSTAWAFIVPLEGFTAWVNDENALIAYDGAAWVSATGTAYTDEMARDAVGAMIADSSTLDVTYNDAGDALTIDVIQTALKPTESLIVACSDETTALTAGTGKVTFRMPYAFTLTAVRASLTTAQTGSGGGGIFTVDINEAGSTILSTKLTIDNTEKTSTTAATAAVISDSSLADDAEITVDIDQIGDGTAKGLKIVLIGHRT